MYFYDIPRHWWRHRFFLSTFQGQPLATPHLSINLSLCCGGRGTKVSAAYSILSSRKKSRKSLLCRKKRTLSPFQQGRNFSFAAAAAATEATAPTNECSTFAKARYYSGRTNGQTRYRVNCVLQNAAHWVQEWICEARG